MAAETEGIFARLANEVLEAAEHIVTRVDEGVAAIMHGKLPDGSRNIDSDPAADLDDDFVMDEDLGGSPLEGIAESVIGDIMGVQVCLVECTFFLSS
jgi:hypothetical protein